MKEVKNRKENPTKQEVENARLLQAPVTKGEQLAKVAMSSRLLFGGQSNWIQTEKLFSETYRNGLESVPFYIVRAFSFVKEGVPKLGIDIVLSNGKQYALSLRLMEGDSKRHQILDLFSDNPKPQPVGPFSLVKLDLGKQMPYYDINRFVAENEITIQRENVEPEIPFIEITIDDDIPF